MKTRIGTFIAAAALSAPAYADSLSTCTRSFDGPGMTACELLGVPGVIGPAYHVNWLDYAISTEPLYEVTAHAASNVLRVDALGQLVYQRHTGHVEWSSRSTSEQFALWSLVDGFVIGIEDLRTGYDAASDYDYNDYVVVATRRILPVVVAPLPPVDPPSWPPIDVPPPVETPTTPVDYPPLPVDVPRPPVTYYPPPPSPTPPAEDIPAPPALLLLGAAALARMTRRFTRGERLEGR